jgi:hypothetical protein
MDENSDGKGWKKPSRPLAAVRTFQAPNLIILSRGQSPPIPGPAVDDGQEKAPRDVDASKEGSKRELRGMSAKSSLSIARVLSSLDWGKNGECVHVTLTYWKTWPGDKETEKHPCLADVKRQLVARLGEHFTSGIWRLEFHPPKPKRPHHVPHWHCLLWCPAERMEEAIAWLRKWWQRFADNSNEEGVHVSSGSQARGTWYLALHAAKREQSPPFKVGRWWGYVNREKLLAAQDINETGVLTERERVWWARLYRRSTGCRTRNAQGLSWFLPLASQWLVSSWIRGHVESEIINRSRGKDPF